MLSYAIIRRAEEIKEKKNRKSLEKEVNHGREESFVE